MTTKVKIIEYDARYRQSMDEIINHELEVLRQNGGYGFEIIDIKLLIDKNNNYIAFIIYKQ